MYVIKIVWFSNWIVKFLGKVIYGFFFFLLKKYFRGKRMILGVYILILLFIGFLILFNYFSLKSFLCKMVIIILYIGVRLRFEDSVWYRGGFDKC